MKIYVTKAQYVKEVDNTGLCNSDATIVIDEDGNAFAEEHGCVAILSADRLRKLSSDIYICIDITPNLAKSILNNEALATKLYTRLLTFHHFGKSDIAPLLSVTKEQAREVIEHLMNAGYVTRGRSMFHLTDSGKKYMTDFTIKKEKVDVSEGEKTKAKPTARPTTAESANKKAKRPSK